MAKFFILAIFLFVGELSWGYMVFIHSPSGTPFVAYREGEAWELRQCVPAVEISQLNPTCKTSKKPFPGGDLVNAFHFPEISVPRTKVSLEYTLAALKGAKDKQKVSTLTAQQKALEYLFWLLEEIESPHASEEGPYFEYDDEFKKVLPAFGVGVQNDSLTLPGVTRNHIATDTELTGSLSERLDMLFDRSREIPSKSDFPTLFGFSGFSAEGNRLERKVILAQHSQDRVQAEILPAFDPSAKYDPGHSYDDYFFPTPLVVNTENSSMDFSLVRIFSSDISGDWIRKHGAPYGTSCVSHYRTRKASLSSGEKVLVVKREDIGGRCLPQGPKPTSIFLIP